MPENLNNQNTLFRFVSLRNPELTKKEHQNKRFVFNSDSVNGNFHLAVSQREENTTKWDAMLTAAKSFNAFANEKAIETSYQQHFELADWVTRNRNTLDIDYLTARLNEIGELQPSDEVKLWDNLFYQVLTQKDFYVKEAVIQLLVLQNILKNKSVFTAEPFDEEIAKQLLSARVVLPTELFDELALTQYVEIEEEEDDDTVPKELVDAQQIEEARIASANIEDILSELNEIEINHREEGENEYKKEFANFQKEYGREIKDKISRYQAEYNSQLRNIGEFYKGKDISYKEKGFFSNKDVLYDRTELCNQPDVEYPELPEFQFEYPQEPDMQKVQQKLPANSLEVLSSQVNLENITSVSKLKQVLTTNLQVAGQQALDKLQTSTKVVVLGDTVIKSGNFVLASNLFKFQICSSRLSNGNASVYMTIQIPDGYNVQKFVYTLNTNVRQQAKGQETLTQNGITDTYFNSSLNGNVLTLRNMFKNTN